jgi:hypothetical protein
MVHTHALAVSLTVQLAAGLVDPGGGQMNKENSLGVTAKRQLGRKDYTHWAARTAQAGPGGRGGVTGTCALSNQATFEAKLRSNEALPL